MLPLAPFFGLEHLLQRWKAVQTDWDERQDASSNVITPFLWALEPWYFLVTLRQQQQELRIRAQEGLLDRVYKLVSWAIWPVYAWDAATYQSTETDYIAR